MEDRSRDISGPLSEVRTVLSRAETAMDSLVAHSYRGNMPYRAFIRSEERQPDGYFGHWEWVGPSGSEPDPDTEAMYYALERTVRDLARWRKAGKRKRR